MQNRTAARRFFFAVAFPGGGGFKRRGPEPPPLSLQGDRILKERGKFEIPLSLSGFLWLLSFDTERKQLAPAGATPSLPQAKKEAPRKKSSKLSLAVRPEIIKHKKDTPRRKAIFTIPPALAGGIYLSPAVAGDIYFVRAVRPGIIKHKKRKAQRASNLYSPHPRQGVGQLKSKKKGP